MVDNQGMIWPLPVQLVPACSVNVHDYDIKKSLFSEARLNQNHMWGFIKSFPISQISLKCLTLRLFPPPIIWFNLQVYVCMCYPAHNLCFIYSEIVESHRSTATLKILGCKKMWICKCCFFPPQACFLLWTCWNLLGAGASPACRHWEITLGSRCSRGVIAAALLSQNQAWCSSDSTSLGLISPQCVLARVGAHHIRWWRGNLCPMDSLYVSPLE